MNFAKSAVASLLVGCFLFGGIAWRIHYRRHSRGVNTHPVVQIIPIRCKSCK